ncbi:MAG: Spy/CpxP family protein refolding chaperone [Enhydrobacter sp.]|nr:Spy/CpxP family protein refolding chaperone [Enhydrobacter sp.]
MKPSLLRTLAITAVASIALAAGASGSASAQTAGTKPEAGKPPAAAKATSTKPETVEQRISALKTALKITPDQESKWEGVAKAMRENAAAMEKLVQEKKGTMASLNAVDDLKTYQEFSQVRLDGLKNLISSFETLYNSMPADQKKNADQVFDNFGPPKPAQQG